MPKIILEARRPEYNREWRIRNDRYYVGHGGSLHGLDKQKDLASKEMSAWQRCEIGTEFRVREVP